MSFYRNGQKAFETTALRAAERAGSRGRTVPLQFSVPLGSLLPGKYTCQAM